MAGCPPDWRENRRRYADILIILHRYSIASTGYSFPQLIRASQKSVQTLSAITMVKLSMS